MSAWMQVLTGAAWGSLMLMLSARFSRSQIADEPVWMTWRRIRGKTTPLGAVLPYGIEANLLHPGWRIQYLERWRREHSGAGVAWGFIARGDDGQDYWITETPKWDMCWFKKNGMREPLLGDTTRTYWRDHGPGLRQLSYAAKGKA